MYQHRIIGHGMSPYSGSLSIVLKKIDHYVQRKERFVIDYGKLNEKMVDDKYPTTQIAELVHKLGLANYFITIGLA